MKLINMATGKISGGEDAIPLTEVEKYFLIIFSHNANLADARWMGIITCLYLGFKGVDPLFWIFVVILAYRYVKCVFSGIYLYKKKKEFK